MGFRDLLAKAVTVATPTSCIHGILKASLDSGNQPLLFENIIESPGHRAALNLLERSLLCESYNIEPSELMDIMLESMLEAEEPRTVDGSRALECEMEVALENLPIPWHHPEDAGRYMSASIIIAQYEGIRNVSFHRQLIIGKDRLVARLVPRHLRTMLEKARANGDEIPIAIVNAPDASVLLAAAMSFNHDLDELTVASALHRRMNGEPLPVVILDNGIMVPADAEYIMQARLTGEVADEGPYVDITGTVDRVRSEPVIVVDSIHHAKNPIMHVLIPGFAEHRNMMGLPRAPAIKDAVNKVTECVDVFLSEGGCGWLSAVVAIEPKSETDAVKAISAAFSGHPSMKQVTIVNSDIDVTNPVNVEWAMMTRWQPDRDTVTLSDQKGSSLDPSRNADGTTAKVGFDATLPIGTTDTDFLSVL